MKDTIFFYQMTSQYTIDCLGPTKSNSLIVAKKKKNAMVRLPKTKKSWAEVISAWREGLLEHSLFIQYYI